MNILELTGIALVNIAILSFIICIVGQDNRNKKQIAILWLGNIIGWVLLIGIMALRVRI